MTPGSERPTLNPLREPALLVVALLAPLVQTGLLLWAGLSDEEQAVWNAVAAALAGAGLAALTAKDRLAPAIIGLSTALLALAAFYGWGLTAEQQTAALGFVQLATGLFLRTQITAPVDAAGRRVLPPANQEEEHVGDGQWPYDDFYEDEPDRPPVNPGVHPGGDADSDTAGLPVVAAPEPPPATLENIEGRRMAG